MTENVYIAVHSEDEYFLTAIKLSKIVYSNFCYTEHYFWPYNNYNFDNFSDDNYNSMIRQHSNPSQGKDTHAQMKHPPWAFQTSPRDGARGPSADVLI